MMRLLPLLFLLAACGTSVSTASGPEAVCEREANNDPTVQHLQMLRVGNTNFPLAGEQELKYRREQLKAACMRRLGAQTGSQGGVEAVRRPTSTFGGLR